ncbi:metallophosphoesterase family protein [Rhodomicrobium vannielii ATCC 17100]|uniref:metallophosphoesterase family protein n=1 Tax=Rhodomicrobium vannielii TaxID=1069 RepID=UPI00191A9680|nr:metallophosphoesterase family protein [Rhodomicrobium vannielii]MBJ7535144.1 metallophosphoesterase family protein [Rhodomicrobium vannielii ATCC 17100]
MTVLGLISDTHGLLRPEAAAALEGVDAILHAGDVGRPDVLAALRTVAPVFAVRGNVDGGELAALPLDTVATVDGIDIYMLHILRNIAIAPAAAGMAVVVSGHTHKPLIEEMDGVLYVNPGSAGPRRFALPVSVGFLRLASGQKPEAWLKMLDV